MTNKNAPKFTSINLKYKIFPVNLSDPNFAVVKEAFYTRWVGREMADENGLEDAKRIGSVD